MKKIKEILDREFIFTDEVARMLELGFGASKNLIIFGPGGHAKSEMIKAVIHGLGLEAETFFQFFGEGMDESKLFGGLDFKKLETEKVLEYHPERSFLNSRIAVFEELFDAPASVLLALKDTLTARELRNGAQRFAMKTEVIICLTNKQPQEISELGPAAHALIERFRCNTTCSGRIIPQRATPSSLKRLRLGWDSRSSTGSKQFWPKSWPKLRQRVILSHQGLRSTRIRCVKHLQNCVARTTWGKKTW
jgi:hypothetical protein